MSNTSGNSMPVVNGVIDLALKIQKTSEDAITAIKNFFNREDKQTQEAVIFDYFSKNSVKYTKEEDNTKDDNKDKDNEIELPVQDRENPLLWLLDKIIKFIVKLFKGRKK